MNEQHIGIAVRQRIAITRAPEDTMTSPYLDYTRSTREIIEELIVLPARLSWRGRAPPHSDGASNAT
jgi:hypothetical protein